MGTIMQNDTAGNNALKQTGCRLAAPTLLMVFYFCCIPAATAQNSYGVLMETKEILISTLDNNYIPESLVVSSDNSHIAYVIGSPSNMRVAIDGIAGFFYDDIFIKSLLFSPDGKRLAYVARQHDDWVVIVDKKEGRRFDEIRADSLSFSPNSRHIAYFARLQNDWFSVIDDTVNEKGYSIIPAGSKIIWDTRRTLHFIAIDYSRSIYSVTVKLKRPPGKAAPKPRQP